MDKNEDRKPYVEFLTGVAGSGKSFELMRRCTEDLQYGLLCATTGIAAVNLGTRTLNSILRFYDTDQMEDKYRKGELHDRLLEVAKHSRHLIVDEVSMLADRQLDFIYDALCELHRDYPSEWSLGLVVSGDFLQLSPVKEKWAFQAECWPEFDANTIKLEGTKRQSDPEFLSGLNFARAGHGLQSLQAFKRAGVEFRDKRLEDYEGTLILAKNFEVEKHNHSQLLKLPGQIIKEKTTRWGRGKPEWKHIADFQEFKIGAYVMILANDTTKDIDGESRFTYANGDCGWIRDYSPLGRYFTIELARNGQMVVIKQIERMSHTKGDQSQNKEAKFDHMVGRWAIGGVTYYPMRLAYASTVHKVQGLTLDRVQVDLHDGFFGQPGMAYVGVSRARTPEGLVVVASPLKYASRVRTAKEVERFI